MLDQVKAITERLAVEDGGRTFLIRAAFEKGATWRMIGDAIGTSPQNAHQKYHYLMPKRSAVRDSGKDVADYYNERQD